jgi:diacylglycerol kinase (ATP)
MKNPISNLKNSWSGLKLAWEDDFSFKVTVVQFGLGIAIASGLTWWDRWPWTLWLLLVGSLFPMLIAETINCAIEAVTDKASPEHHPLAKKAKDIGSTAVFIARLLIILCWTVGIASQIDAIRR